MQLRQMIFVPPAPPVWVSREHSWQGEEGGWYVARSIALWCPKCCAAWAILQLEEDDLVFPIGVLCRKHADRADHWLAGVPGSVFVQLGWGVIDTPLLEALPGDLLQREALIHLDYAERNQDGRE